MTHRLEPLLNPSSIAIIGASTDPGRIGGMPIELLTRYGYAGKIYPVNPKYSSAFGLECWPDIESVPQPVDLAVLAIGAQDVLPMLRRCRSRGAKSAIVYAAGFAEQNEAGMALQREIEEFAALSGMVVAGPNCMGLANLNTQAHTAFASVFKTSPMQQEPGRVSLLTQSGNVCSALYGLLRKLDLPVSQFINTGNEACVDFAEYLQYLAEDPHTEIVLGYMEQLRDGPGFMRACRSLQQQDKVLVALKAGATDKGAQAVRSHTSALAGDRRVYRAAFEQLNVIEARDFAQMAWLARLAQLRHRGGGRRVAVITMSGALGAILADRFIEAGLELPDLPEAVQAVLRAGIPDYGMVGNPVDVTGNVVNDPGFVRTVLESLASTPAVDAVVIYAPGYMLDRMADAIAEVAQRHPRLIAAIDTGQAKCRDALRAAEVAVFEDLGVAVSALGPYLTWCERRKQVRAWAVRVPPAGAAALPPLPAHELDARRYLAGFGLQCPQEAGAADVDEACAIAGRLGYPVVLKLLSAHVAHKTELGAVALNLADEAALRAAAQRMLQSVRAARPDIAVAGLLVQKMERRGMELIVGARRDPVFGPMLTVGMGGVLTEIYQDTSHGLLPLDRAAAARMLRGLRIFPLLEGFRGMPAYDVDAACEAMVAIGDALVAAPAQVAEIEVNPLWVRPQGQGAVALDALLLAADACPESGQASHRAAMA
ncbi:acetate--CoA ligase family protein [Candidimonas humi]|jgi:acyl-CoA synthetase (NDP forming)|uniref:Acetate--CoA ligase family protein n=1 Tax=Candidimonas humi TaxID=683355 RepID=A0ABV8P037_9BURK|nr:acetate--CoA ligase [Candidimonas humi]MBV6306449.1 acetate--CoA ligase family protein [Candidimonas humi]